MNLPSKILLGIKPRTIAVAIGLSFAICGTASTQAAPILGAEIFVKNSSDHVIAQFLGAPAGFNNLLLLNSPPTHPGVIFTGHVTPPFTTVDLGAFPAGTLLIFELNNQAMPPPNIDGTFFTGPAALNPDNLAHAKVDFQFAPGELFSTFVGFEDTFGGGDRSFDDLTFTLSNVRGAVPDGGSTATLLGSAVLVLAFLRKFAHR